MKKTGIKKRLMLDECLVFEHVAKLMLQIIDCKRNDLYELEFDFTNISNFDWVIHKDCFKKLVINNACEYFPHDFYLSFKDDNKNVGMLRWGVIYSEEKKINPNGGQKWIV